MKKILFILLVFISFCCGFKVYAADEIFIEGSFDDYEIEGKEFVGGNFDKDKEGDYVLKYVDYRNMFYDRKVKVISKETLLNGYSIISEENSYLLKDNRQYSIKGRCEINDITLFYGNVFMNGDNSLGLLEPNNACLLFLNKDGVFTKLIDNRISTIVSVCRAGNTFIVLKEVEEDGGMYLYIAEYFTNGALMREKKLIGNGSDRGYGIYLSNGFIYVTIDSSSVKDYYATKFVNKRTVGVIRLNYRDLEFNGFVSIGNDTSNRIIDSTFFNNSIYIMMENVVGKGDFNKEINNNRIIRIDEGLNVKKYINIESGYKVNGLFIYNDMLTYTIINKENKKMVTVYSVNDDLTKSSEISYYFNSNIYSVCGNKESNSNCLVVNSSNGVNAYSIGLIDNNGVTISIDTDYKFLYVFNKDNKPYVGTYGNNKISDFVYYRIKGEEKDGSLLIYEEDILLDKKVKRSSNEDNTFGMNYDYVYYEGKSFVLHSLEENFIELDSNIIDGEYEKGSILNANAKTYLNNELIGNGYVFDEYGTYTLKFVGLNDEEVTSAITISDVALRADDKELNNIEIKKCENKDEYPNINNDVSFSLEQQEKESNNSFSLFIIPFSLLILSGIFIPLKWRKK